MDMFSICHACCKFGNVLCCHFFPARCQVWEFRSDCINSIPGPSALTFNGDHYKGNCETLV